MIRRGLDKGIGMALGVEVAIATVIGAVLIGAGVPAFWLWLASIIAGDTNTVTASLAIFIATGILLSYWLIAVAASWARGRLRGDEEAPKLRRASWNRSMRDEPFRPGSGRIDPIERLFVVTTVISAIAFMIWMVAFAGSPLPGGEYGG
jgi:hypothetical protein